MSDILILGAVVIVAGLFALFTIVSFLRLPENEGLDLQERH